MWGLPNAGQINKPGAQNSSNNVGYFYSLTVGPGGISNAGSANVAVSAIGNVATYAPTAAQAGQTFLLNRAAGTIVTLPAPVVGLRYSFIVTTAVTSNNYKIITDTGTTLLQGIVEEATAGGAASIYTGNGSSHISVLMNGTTTGGLLGTQITVTCVTSTLWQVNGINIASGTIATPFSTT